jgi:hypothetical protein
MFLDRNSFSEQLSPAIGQLQELRRLSISVNSISGVLPQELGNLQNLEFLDLHSNRTRVVRQRCWMDDGCNPVHHQVRIDDGVNQHGSRLDAGLELRPVDRGASHQRGSGPPAAPPPCGGDQRTGRGGSRCGGHVGAAADGTQESQRKWRPEQRWPAVPGLG